MNHIHNESGSCCLRPTLVQQSLEEMDFERGIWHAALHNEVPRLKSLLARTSADVPDTAGYTALHYAARGGHFESCQILLNAGASVNAQTRAGRVTALHRAASMGHLDIVKLLIKYGADISLKDSDGYDAIQRAASSGKEEIIEVLKTSVTTGP